MFVKRDLRKIPEILSACLPNNDDDDETKNEIATTTGGGVLKELRLARRPAEFNGTISILCQPQLAPALTHLQALSLYDCNISNLDGIGFFGSPPPLETDTSNQSGNSCCCPNLMELNLGRNPLTKLPSELSLLKGSLKILWCDDCNLSGPLPDCLYELDKLETLRMTNNKISELSNTKIQKWKHSMKVLSLDGNELVHLPLEMTNLTTLNTLLLRNNKLKSLPEGLPGPSMSNLSFFHISSNELTSLPTSIIHCTSLEKVYLNGNKISNLPPGFAKQLSKLSHLNLTNNSISEDLPQDFTNRFGFPDKHSGQCTKVSTAITPSPFLFSHTPL